MEKLQVPIWHKAVLSVREASSLAGIDEGIIRAAAWKALNKRIGNFSVFRCGRKFCIPREPFIRWIEEHGRLHTKFCIGDERAMVANIRDEIDEGPKRGRPRGSKNKAVEHERNQER